MCDFLSPTPARPARPLKSSSPSCAPALLASEIASQMRGSLDVAYKRLQSFLQSIDPRAILWCLLPDEAPFVLGDGTEIPRPQAYKTSYVGILRMCARNLGAHPRCTLSGEEYSLWLGDFLLNFLRLERPLGRMPFGVGSGIQLFWLVTVFRDSRYLFCYSFALGRPPTQIFQ